MANWSKENPDKPHCVFKEKILTSLSLDILVMCVLGRGNETEA